MKNINKFPIWKVVKIGTGLKTADDFRRAFKAICHKIGESANDILGRAAFIISKCKKEINLVIVTPIDLGFKYNTTRLNIYKRAQELDLELCSPEVGPQLRLQYKNQPPGEYLHIAMLPILGENNQARAFGIERDGNAFFLHAANGSPESVWSVNSKWVFVRRR